jgi:hypothetical protein
MRRIILACFAFSLLTIQPSRLFAQDQIRDLVVKIHAIHNTPDLLRPWTRNSPQQVKGSGVVIDGKLFTNARGALRQSDLCQPNQRPAICRRASKR